MAVINARPGEVEVNIEGETHRFSFDLNQKTFGLLVDKLYTNKIRAVERELWTNALDSHIAAGKGHVPFEVQLPGALDPLFKVRDYGTSMDHDTVMKLYTTIGYSSSEGSNDFIGAMGLGSKSPFSYTDHFTVICWLNGEKRIYTAYNEADGVPAIKHIMTMPSEEPQGVEVSFAVKPHDYGEFEKEARFLAIGFDVPPIGLEYDVPQPKYAYKNWKVYESVSGLVGGGFHVRMGAVIYPVHSTQMTEFGMLVNRSHALVYDVPIGSVDVAASREALSMDSNTEEFLSKTQDEVRAEIGEYVALQFVDCKTLLEAELRRLDFESEVFRQPSIPFGNKAALNGTIAFDRWDDPIIVDRDGTQVRNFSVKFRHDYRFIIIRTKQKVLRRNLRLKAYFKDIGYYRDRHLVLTDPTAKQLERLVRRLGLKPDQIVSVSTLPDVQVVPRMVGGVKGAKGVYVRNDGRKYYDKDYLIQPEEVDLKSNYYWLLIDKRAANGNILGGTAPRLTVERSGILWSWHTLLNEAGHGFDADAVYVFTETAHRRLKPKADKRFDEAIWNTILNLPDLTLALEFHLFKEATRYHYRLNDIQVMQLIYGMSDEHVEAYKKYSKLLGTGNLGPILIRHFGLKLNTGDNVKKDYPMLFGEPEKAHILEYIQWRKEKLAEALDND